jgi:hypothetical protein
MKLKVEQVGNPKYPRYVLALENGCYFDGTGWTPNKKKAIRYASLPVIKEDWKQLQGEMEKGLIELVGTVVVRITGTKELTAQQIEALAHYLATASTLKLNYSLHRPPGLENLVISTQIHWDLRPRK